MGMSDDESGTPPKKEVSEKVKVKRGIVLSDDEDEVPIGKKSNRKAEIAKKAKLIEEQEARELMEVDDGMSSRHPLSFRVFIRSTEKVQRIQRGTLPPQRRPNPLEFVEEDEDNEATVTVSKGKVKQEASDVEMSMDLDEPEPPEDEDSDVPVVKPKRKRAEKTAVPVGKNGIKKRKVTKTRHFKGEDGYMRELLCRRCMVRHGDNVVWTQKRKTILTGSRWMKVKLRKSPTRRQSLRLPRMP